MRTQRITLGFIGAAAVALVVTGCSQAASTGAGTPGGSGTSATASTAAGITLMTADTRLGAVVVDGKGLTVYFYDKDSRGESTSACTGQCLAQWPPVTTTGAPRVSGVTGTVGTIAGPGGAEQVTIDGLPIYTFVGDAAAGDVKGQGVGKVWWAVAPDGSKVTAAATGGY